MALPEDQKVVETLATDTAQEPLTKRIGSGGTIGDLQVFDVSPWVGWRVWPATSGG